MPDLGVHIVPQPLWTADPEVKRKMTRVNCPDTKVDSNRRYRLREEDAPENAPEDTKLLFSTFGHESLTRLLKNPGFWGLYCPSTQKELTLTDMKINIVPLLEGWIQKWGIKWRSLVALRSHTKFDSKRKTLWELCQNRGRLLSPPYQGPHNLTSSHAPEAPILLSVHSAR